MSITIIATASNAHPIASSIGSMLSTHADNTKSGLSSAMFSGSETGPHKGLYYAKDKGRRGEDAKLS